MVRWHCCVCVRGGAKNPMPAHVENTLISGGGRLSRRAPAGIFNTRGGGRSSRRAPAGIFNTRWHRIFGPAADANTTRQRATQYPYRLRAARSRLRQSLQPPTILRRQPLIPVHQLSPLSTIRRSAICSEARAANTGRWVFFWCRMSAYAEPGTDAIARARNSDGAPGVVDGAKSEGKKDEVDE